jgi:uncharacterized membrane protein YsdA (DUF1294 family)
VGNHPSAVAIDDSTDRPLLPIRQSARNLLLSPRQTGSQKKAWRTPEIRLHQLEFLGGWLGAFIAQQVFRHKTSKQSFQLTFNLIVILHLATLANLFLFKGQYWWINLLILCVVLFQMNHSRHSKAYSILSHPPKLKPRHQHPIIRK